MGQGGSDGGILRHEQGPLPGIAFQILNGGRLWGITTQAEGLQKSQITCLDGFFGEKHLRTLLGARRQVSCAAFNEKQEDRRSSGW
jgi:hypothetical protein